MSRQLHTYTVKKHLKKTTQKTTNFRKHIFDEVFPQENVFDVTDAELMKNQRKRTANKRRKRRNKDLTEVKEGSVSDEVNSENNAETEASDRPFMMFYEDSYANKKLKNAQKQKNSAIKTRQKTSHNINKKKKEPIKHISETNNMSPAVSDISESTNVLVIEDTVVPSNQAVVKPLASSEQKPSEIPNVKSQTSKEERKENSSDEDGGVYYISESLDKDDFDSSIEIPREVNYNSMAYCGNFTQGSLVAPEESDEDSLPVMRHVKTKAEPAIDFSLSLSRPTDYFPSCERAESGSKFSKIVHSRSDYTYSYVSTYTEETATGSMKTTLSSPPVKMRLGPTLNSTPYKGKDYIGVVEFPDTISPVCQPRASSQEKYSRHDVLVRHGEPENLKMREKTNNAPKSSTVLFGSDQSSSMSLGSVDLTTIYSQEILTTESQKRYTVLGNNSDMISTSKQLVHPAPLTNHDNNNKTMELRVTNINESYVGQNKRKSVKASTPQENAVQIYLSMSPIESLSQGSDELPLNISTLVNSDEIIVPSLIELTEPFQSFSHENQQLNSGKHSGNASSHTDRRDEHQKKTSCLSSYVETNYLNSSSKNDQRAGNSVITKNQKASVGIISEAQVSQQLCDNMSLIETSQRHKDGSQKLTTKEHKDGSHSFKNKHKIKTKFQKYSSREFPSVIDNLSKAEIHKWSSGSNLLLKQRKQNVATPPNNEKHSTSPSDAQEYLPKANIDTQPEPLVILSDKSSVSSKTKNVHSSKSDVQIFQSLNICYINRLCLATLQPISRNCSYQEKQTINISTENISDLST